MSTNIQQKSPNLCENRAEMPKKTQFFHQFIVDIVFQNF